MTSLGTFTDKLSAADPDRVRAASLADPREREKLIWIYAFHLELAKVPELVSERMIGEIRYQWWRDAIEEIYAGGRVRAHEVTTPLTDILRDCDVPRFWCDKLIDGRSRDLDPAPFADIAAAREYCRQTSGVLMQIASKVLSNDIDAELAGQAGAAWGLTGLCRAYPYYHSTMLAGVEFADLCEAASAAHSAARLSKVRPEIMPACAYAALVPRYLRHMKKPGFDPRAEKVILSPFGKQLTQLKAVMTGRL